MPIKVQEKNIHLDRPVRPEELEHFGDARIRSGQPEGPDLKNHDIEKPEKRTEPYLKPNQANMCITILMGEELGEIQLGIQYEGYKGAGDICLRNQNDLTGQIGELLHDLFDDAEGTWEVAIDAQPARSANQEAFHMVELCQKIEQGVVSSVHRVESTQNVSIEHNRQRDIRRGES